MGPSDPKSIRRKRDEKSGQVFPRLVKLKLSTSEAKGKLMKNQRSLKDQVPAFHLDFGSSYIRPDMTQIEMQANRRLREQATQLENENPGTKYRIFRGQVVPDGRDRQY